MGTPRPPKGPQPTVQLSAREREVITLLAQGVSMVEIAMRLNRSLKTIETYRQRVQRKLGIRGLANLTRYAIRQGWVEP